MNSRCSSSSISREFFSCQCQNEKGRKWTSPDIKLSSANGSAQAKWVDIEDYAFNMIISILLALFSGLIVQLLAPAAAGGGVTHVMAYLNGVHIPELLQPSTLIVKILGELFAYPD